MSGFVGATIGRPVIRASGGNDDRRQATQRIYANFTKLAGRPRVAPTVL